jgi:hypothetical protein
LDWSPTQDYKELSGDSRRGEKGRIALNYAKQHKSLRWLLAAMVARLNDTLWSMTDLAEMIDGSLPKPGLRSRYKKQIA